MKIKLIVLLALSTVLSSVESNNLTAITWAHAINSDDLLTVVLKSAIDMIEADVVWGTIRSKPLLPMTAVMAHPPEIDSDITLGDFLNRVSEHNRRNTNNQKGVKLDFKSTRVFEGSLKILKALWHQLTYPVWLNADIMAGAVGGDFSAEPVNAARFFAVCKFLPNAVLSIGWTTMWNFFYRDGQYLEAQIEGMIKTLRDNNITRNGQTLTFPVRAGVVTTNKANIKYLLETIKQTNNATLTIWSSAFDYVDVDELRAFIYDFGVEQIYLDVPDFISEQLKLQ